MAMAMAMDPKGVSRIQESLSKQDGCTFMGLHATCSCSLAVLASESLASGWLPAFETCRLA